MGCDGGTIPRRDELVKTKKKAEAKDKNAELAFQWLCCAISQQLLAAPVVMCGLGRLYNKESVIEGLLNRSILPATAEHIKTLKDIKELKLAPNPEYKPGDEKKEGSFDEKACPYICPITGLEMSGKFKFVALWSCGCVFSERAFKQIGDKICVNCQMEFSEEDVVILNAKEKDLTMMIERMVRRQMSLKKKKIKKIKIKKEIVVFSGDEICAQLNDEHSCQNGTSEVTEKPVKVEPGPSSSLQEKRKRLLDDLPDITVIRTSKPECSVSKPLPLPGPSDTKKIKILSDVVINKDKATGKRSTAESSQKSSSLLLPTTAPKAVQKTTQQKLPIVGQKKAKRELSVADDPQKSDVYKSLFTSHQSEKEQNRAHWVTYNPFYN